MPLLYLHKFKSHKKDRVRAKYPTAFLNFKGAARYCLRLTPFWWLLNSCKYVMMIGTAIADLLAWLGLAYFLSDERPGLTGGAAVILPWFTDASMTLSDWILVVFSWERLLVISNPFRFAFLQRVVTARCLIVVLAALSFACHMASFAMRYDLFIFNLHSTAGSFYSSPLWLQEWDVVDRKGLVAVPLLTFLLILIPSVILIIFLMGQRRFEFGINIPGKLILYGTFCRPGAGCGRI
ncbi:uncharacterized protein LOC129593120 [Paramacrobiotus metropolitanus]|uniref:uncharacterized protein LOC129593120 n=1 Tax=Paramacrobiotus metropolitanus TaxID=2943436 RepID=UPI0024460B4F|nr:uncharacterized protein LOC129593120 [Paramacrobiotus metropolitanus]